MVLFLAFLLVPLIEIALFVQVGGLIGLWPTLAVVILTAILGTSLVRSQGRLALSRLQRSFSQLGDPTEPLADGAMILLAGALLVTPGFFTDAVGFALLIPAVRGAVFRYLASRVKIRTFQTGPGAEFRESGAGDVIDGEFEEVRAGRGANTRPSGWVSGPNRH
jgi:UPF0716 protein FxsA